MEEKVYHSQKSTAVSRETEKVYHSEISEAGPRILWRLAARAGAAGSRHLPPPAEPPREGPPRPARSWRRPDVALSLKGSVRAACPGLRRARAEARCHTRAPLRRAHICGAPSQHGGGRLGRAHEARAPLVPRAVAGSGSGGRAAPGYRNARPAPQAHSDSDAPAARGRSEPFSQCHWPGPGPRSRCRRFTYKARHIMIIVRIRMTRSQTPTGAFDFVNVTAIPAVPLGNVTWKPASS